MSTMWSSPRSTPRSTRLLAFEETTMPDRPMFGSSSARVSNSTPSPDENLQDPLDSAFRQSSQPRKPQEQPQDIPKTAPKPTPAPPKPAAKPPALPAPPEFFTIKDLGISDVDMVLGGKDITSGAIVAFPVRRINIITASSVMADMLKDRPPPFGTGPDSIKKLPYLLLDENALLMERVLPYMYNELDLPKSTDIHFVRAVYLAADKYKMRRLFDWMTERLRAGWPSTSAEVALGLYAATKLAKDDDLAAQILTGTLEKYTWTLNREAENKWTCDLGNGAKPLKDFTDAYGLEVLLAVANKRQCMACKKLAFREEKPAKEDKPEEAKKE